MNLCRAISDHRCSLRAIRISLTRGLAFTLFPPEKHCRCPFRPLTLGSQFCSGIDFPSGNRKLFTCHSTHGVNLRPPQAGLKVLGLFLKSSAKSFNNGFGSSQATKVMGQLALRKAYFCSGNSGVSNSRQAGPVCGIVVLHASRKYQGLGLRLVD